MKRLAILVLVTASACVSASARRAKGPAVDVYEAESSAAPALRSMPEGCRLLATSGPIDQMESERYIDDPYNRERQEVAQKGGNALLVLSHETVTRPNYDCPSGNVSADCLRGGQSWYRIRFEDYACAPDALAELKALPPAQPTGGITLLLGGRPKPAGTPSAPEPASSLTPMELKTKVLDMMRENVAPSVILAYVRGKRLSRKMTAEEIIEWTRAGIPDAVIEAAASR